MFTTCLIDSNDENTHFVEKFRETMVFSPRLMKRNTKEAVKVQGGGDFLGCSSSLKRTGLYGSTPFKRNSCRKCTRDHVRQISWEKEHLFFFLSLFLENCARAPPWIPNEVKKKKGAGMRVIKIFPKILGVSTMKKSSSHINKDFFSPPPFSCPSVIFQSEELLINWVKHSLKKKLLFLMA